ncbi:C-C motif chemokine 5-like [Anolis carolinensis]|uniref:C-C motif chemokine 5-like n=1 Tax=Anolis carolinensis TaxID=28377 RepID=UPI002F2B4305
MRSSSVAAVVAALAFLVALTATSVQGQVHSADPGLCCFAYVHKPLPLKNIVSFESSNHKCHSPAVIFITVTGRRVCADPQAQWVQQRIAGLSAQRPRP